MEDLTELIAFSGPQIKSGSSTLTYGNMNYFLGGLKFLTTSVHTLKWKVRAAVFAIVLLNHCLYYNLTCEKFIRMCLFVYMYLCVLIKMKMCVRSLWNWKLFNILTLTGRNWKFYISNIKKKMLICRKLESFMSAITWHILLALC